MSAFRCPNCGSVVSFLELRAEVYFRYYPDGWVEYDEYPSISYFKMTGDYVCPECEYVAPDPRAFEIVEEDDEGDLSDEEG